MKNSVSETKEMKSINNVIDFGSSSVGGIGTINLIPLGQDVPELVRLVDIPNYFLY